MMVFPVLHQGQHHPIQSGQPRSQAVRCQRAAADGSDDMLASQNPSGPVLRNHGKARLRAYYPSCFGLPVLCCSLTFPEVPAVSAPFAASRANWKGGDTSSVVPQA